MKSHFLTLRGSEALGERGARAPGAGLQVALTIWYSAVAENGSRCTRYTPSARAVMPADLLWSGAAGGVADNPYFIGKREVHFRTCCQEEKGGLGANNHL